MRKLKRNESSRVDVRKNIRKRFEAVSPSEIGRSRDIVDWAIDFIEDELPEWEGKSVYGGDLATELTYTVNRTGSYEDDAWGFISSHINDARDEYEYEEDQFGKVVCNPFKDPDGFVVCMLINTVDNILAEVPLVKENWNEYLELTKENIDAILKSLR